MRCFFGFSLWCMLGNLSGALVFPIDVDADGIDEWWLSDVRKPTQCSLVRRATQESREVLRWEKRSTELPAGLTLSRDGKSWVFWADAGRYEITPQGKWMLVEKKPEVTHWDKAQQRVSFDDNGDGRVDWFLLTSGEKGQRAWICHGRGEGRFGKPFPWQVAGEVWEGAMSSPHFAWWDEDDDLDLLCLMNGRLRYVENTNTNSEPIYAESREVIIEGGPPGRIEVFSPWDLHRDGRLDLLVQMATGELVWFKRQSGFRSGAPVFRCEKIYRQ